MASILSQINPLHTLQTCLYNMHLLLSSHLFKSAIIPSDCVTKINRIFFVCFMRATRPAHLIPLI